MFPRGLVSEYASTLSMVARFFDILCIVLGAVISYIWRFGYVDFPLSYQIAILIATMLTLIVFSLSGIYTSWRGKSWLHQARIISIAWLGIVVILIIMAFLTKTSTVFSRQWMVTWSLSAMGFMLIFRFSFTKFLGIMRQKGWNHKRIIIIGVGELGQSVAKKINDAAWSGLDIVAFIDDSHRVDSDEIEGIHVHHGLDGLCQVVENKKIDEVWFALPLREELRMKEVLAILRHSTVNIRFVPGIFGFRLLNHSFSEVAGLPVIDLNASPMVGISRFIKATEDRLFALAILVLVSPLLVLVAIGVKMSSPGPVFFKQLRLGWDGKPIRIYKFRTMVIHEEKGGLFMQATKNDARVTRFGAFLRRSSLDELPQFFNVLQGKMSIVGPRPHPMPLNEQYKDLIDTYMQRHKVKPGITGWAQVNGWRGETDTLEKMKRRVEYDLYYIENWSLWMDIKIIFLTMFSGFVHRNAY